MHKVRQRDLWSALVISQSNTGHLLIGLAYKWPFKPTSLYVFNGLELQMFPGAQDVTEGVVENSNSLCSLPF